MAGMNRLNKEFNLSGTFVTSTAEDFELVRRYAPHHFNVIQYENQPVSNKFNHGFFEAMKSDWDYLLIIGSDDLLSNEGLQLLLDAGRPYVGFGEMHIFGAETHEWRRFKYEEARLIGAGRLIAREALNSFVNRCTTYFRKDQELGGIVYKAHEPFEISVDGAKYLESIGLVKHISKPYNLGLWENGLNRAMDNSSELRLLMKGYTPFKVISDKVHVVDVKTDQNITSWSRFADVKPNDDPKWFMSYEEREIIRGLRFEP